MDNEITVDNEALEPMINDAANDSVICTAVGAQAVDLCVPVTVRPSAVAGQTLVKCCGSPVITPGIDICPDTPITMCGFTINQKICIEVPVQFGADAETGDAHIACHPAVIGDEGCRRLCDQYMSENLEADEAEAADSEAEVDPDDAPEADPEA